MVRDPQLLLFVGIGHFVVALDRRTGTEVWRAGLKRAGFVSVLWDGDALVAASAGEIYRLDPRTGAVLWHNEMPGLGLGVVTLASERASTGGDGVAPKAHVDAVSAAASAG
jgi:outer membrane protein assembly factor BamB